MTLERTACLGDCPVYQVVIHSDGRVEWRGERHVAVLGAARRCVAPDRVAALWQKLESALAHSSAECVSQHRTSEGSTFHFGETDQPSLRLTLDGVDTTTWEHDFGCPVPLPEGLREAEASIRELVDLDVWEHGTRSEARD